MTQPGIPSRFGPDTSPPDVLYARVRENISATPAPRVSTRLRIVIALSSVPFLAAAVVLIAAQFAYERHAVRVDLATHSVLHLKIVLLLLGLLTLVATLVALGRGPRGFGSGAVSLTLVAALVAPVYAALTFVSAALSRGATFADSLISPLGLRCLSIALIIGVIVLGSFTVALRRSVPVASRLRGAALGAAAGAWGGLSVFVFCPSGETLHLLVGHILPLIVFTLLGLLTIPRALQP